MRSQLLTFTGSAASQVMKLFAFGALSGQPRFDLLAGVHLRAFEGTAGYALIGAGLLAIPLAARLRQMRRRSRILTRVTRAAA